MQEMIESGTEKELAVFLHLKSKFINSCIYNYTQQSLADKTGFSRSFIKKYISFFLKEKWAFMHGDNLMLVKVSKIDRSNKKKILIDIDTSGTYKDILERLQYEYLKHKAAQAEWYSKLCRDLKQMSLNEAKAKEKKISKKVPYLKIRHKASYGESGNDKFRVSFSMLAKWFKCSVGKAHSIIKKLCRTGFIDYTVRYLTVKAKNAKEAKQRLINDPKSFYTNRGYVCRVACNEYVFR